MRRRLVALLLLVAGGCLLVSTQGPSHKYLASDPGDSQSFGHALAVNDDYLAVGDPEANRVALYRREANGSWSRTGEILPPSGSVAAEMGSGFGYALALNDETLVIGASGADGYLFSAPLFGSVYFASLQEEGIGPLREIPIPDANFVVGNAVSFLGDQIALAGMKEISPDNWAGRRVFLADASTGEITQVIEAPGDVSFGTTMDTASGALLIGVQPYYDYLYRSELLLKAAYLATADGKLEKISFKDDRSQCRYSATGKVAMAEDFIGIACGTGFRNFDKTFFFRQSESGWSLVGSANLGGPADASHSHALISSMSLSRDMYSHYYHSYHEPDFLLVRVDADEIVVESEIRWLRHSPPFVRRGIIDSGNLLLSAQGQIVQLPIANLSRSYVIKPFDGWDWLNGIEKMRLKFSFTQPL